jgi:hypothetical protein
VNCSYTDSGGSLTLEVTNGYLDLGGVYEDDWIDSTHASWSGFLANLSNFWGDAPHVIDYAVSGNQLTIIVDAEEVLFDEPLTFTQIAASANRIGGWYMTEVVDSVNVRTRCNLDRQHIEMMSYNMDSDDVPVWGVEGSYTLDGSSMTLTLQKGYDGELWFYNGDPGWAAFVSDFVEPYWGDPPYVVDFNASGAELQLTIDSSAYGFDRL